MKPADFLRGLWGNRPPGLIQIWTLADKQTSCLNSPADADGLASGVDVYTAVCTASEPISPKLRAKGAQLGGLAALWLDIDIDRPGHTGGAPDIDAAAHLARAHSEPTILIASGHGVHAWYVFQYPWRLATSEQRSEAQRASTGWYALHRKTATDRDFDLDPSTRDLTRLLRLPSTLNGKTDPPTPVEVLEVSKHRHDRRDLFELAGTADTTGLASVSPIATVVPVSQVVDDERLRLLFDADQDLEATFMHRNGRPHWSLSEYDMALASRAVEVMSDQQVAELLVTHRLHHDAEDGKARRVDYLRRTVAKARAGLNERQGLADLATSARAA